MAEQKNPGTGSSEVEVRPLRKLPVRAQAPATGRSQDQGQDRAQQDTIIDAEIVEELEGRPAKPRARETAAGPHASPKSFAAWRDRIIKTVREKFTDSWAEAARIKEAAMAADYETAVRMMAEYDPDWAARQQRSAQNGASSQQDVPEADRDSRSDRAWLKDMRSGLRDADAQFMKSLRDSNIVVPGYGKDQQVREFNVMRKVHTRMMMQMCMTPLQRGVSVSSVVQSATTMTALMVLSPDFRAEVGEKAGEVRDYVRDRADARTRKRADKARHHAAEGLPNRYGQFSSDYRDHVSRRQLKRIDALERRDRGNRDMFTPDTAAMTEVGLMDSAYWRMREPDANVDEVLTSYRSMRDLLHQQMADDGLDQADVMTRARIIIGQRMETEPEVRTMFNGMAHGRVQKSAPRTIRLPNSQETVQAWTGEFEDHLGQPLPDDGIFVLRKPQEVDEHQVRLARTMTRSITDSLTRGDAEALQMDLYCYPVVFAAQQKGLSVEDLPEAMQHRAAQTQTMIATMGIDGLSAEQQREAFSNAYVDAINEVMEDVPDFQQRVEATLGHSWDQTLERMQHASADPETFVDSMRQAHQKRRRQAHEQAQWHAEPTPDPQPQSA